MRTARRIASSAALGYTYRRTYCEERNNRTANVNFETLDRVTGNYENRIKFNSAPEKVFEYYASKKESSSDRPAMSFSDFMHSLIPHTFKSSYLVVPPELYDDLRHLIDLDGDGVVSFSEYIFCTSLITTSYSDLKTAFKMFSNERGKLGYAEFSDFMTAIIRQSPRGAKYRPTVALDPRGVSCSQSVKEIVADSDFSTYLFGKNPAKSTKEIDFSDLIQLIKRIQQSILYYEFARHSSGTNLTKTKSERLNDCISAAEFATLLAGFMKPNSIEKYSDRVQKIDWSDLPPITFQDLRVFESLTIDIPRLRKAIHLLRNMGGQLDRKGLVYMMEKMVPEKSKNSDTIAEIVFRVFDDNGDGVLCDEEFVAVLENRLKRWNPVQLPCLNIPCVIGRIKVCYQSNLSTSDSF